MKSPQLLYLQEMAVAAEIHRRTKSQDMSAWLPLRGRNSTSGTLILSHISAGYIHAWGSQGDWVIGNSPDRGRRW